MYNNTGKYEYQELFMGLCNTPDMFQENMNKLFNGLDYIDQLLIISNKPFEDQINKLDKIFSKLKLKSFQINIEKSNT